MTLTPEQSARFDELARPLIQWLNENAHPHCEIHVTPTSATLAEGVTAYQTEEFTHG